MRITDSRGGCWPTPFQELLLKATLLKTDAALRAWQEWFEQDGLDRLDNGSYRLLPMTYRNLQRLGYDDPVMMRLKGVSRRAWCENHMVFRRMAPVLAALHGAGISTLILKGAALTLLHYRDFGLRPMQDLDILVPEERALDSISLLEGQGWQRETLPAVRFGRFFLSYRHAAISSANRKSGLICIGTFCSSRVTGMLISFFGRPRCRRGSRDSLHAPYAQPINFCMPAFTAWFGTRFRLCVGCRRVLRAGFVPH